MADPVIEVKKAELGKPAKPFCRLEWLAQCR